MNLFANLLINKLPNYADIMGIPCFFIAFWYFYSIENKNTIEYVLLFGSFIGFILDFFFTYWFITHTK